MSQTTLWGKAQAEELAEETSTVCAVYIAVREASSLGITLDELKCVVNFTPREIADRLNDHLACGRFIQSGTKWRARGGKMETPIKLAKWKDV